MPNKIKIQIVGISSFLGRTLAKELLQKGFEVVGLCRKQMKGLSCEIYCSDLTLDDPMIFPGVEIVIYLAQSDYYNAFPDGFDSLIKVNTIMPIEYAKAAEKARVKHFFYASTGTVYKPSFDYLSESHPTGSINSYAYSKLSAENFLNCLDIDMGITCLRIFSLYGEGQKKMLPYHLTQKVINSQCINLYPASHDEVNPGGIEISFLHINKATNSILLLIKAVMEEKRLLPFLLNIAGPKAISIKDFSLNISKNIGIEPIFSVSDQLRSFDLKADISLLELTIKVKEKRWS